MASKYILSAFVLLLAAFSATFAYAQQPGMRNSTTGGSVDVLINPMWPTDDSAPTNFEMKFLQPGTDTIQEHIDYNFVIKKDGQQVFTAALPGQPLLHTVEGVTIPYKFESNGDYTIEVSVSGINFVPISTETATFNVTVTPEFPAGALVAVAAVMGAAVVLSRRLKR
jgi:hypothetical protein